MFIASLADYVNGIVHGKWLLAHVPLAELEASVQAVLASSPWTARTGEPAEEWIILDHEGFRAAGPAAHRGTGRRCRPGATPKALVGERVVSSELRILRSAYKHGISRADIETVLDTLISRHQLDDERVLFIGYSTTGVEVELVALVGPPLAIIHAMPLRRSLHRYLNQRRPR